MNHSIFSIADNLQNVRQELKKAEQDRAPANGEPNRAVALLAVSKKQSAQRICEAVNAGQTLFGENYLSEALEKQDQLRELLSPEQYNALQWHFIGPVQSNKTRLIAERFHWVQSLDRLKIAERLNTQRPEGMPPLNICIQINVDDEQSKSGIALAELDELAEQVAQMEHLCLRGLMAIPKAAQPEQQTAKSFAAMASAFEKLQASYESVDTLSIGMSGDFRLAIAHGSTMVRIGTALFGQRN